MNDKAIVDRQIVDNHWQHLDDEAALPASGDICVSLTRWESDNTGLKKHDGKVAVRLPNDINIEEIDLDITHIPMIVLDFPIIDTNKRGYHPDGKAYSQARVLREHCGYSGELRAVGQGVYGDVLAYMERCGINAFELREGEEYKDALARFNEFSQAYQPAVSGPQPILLRRRTAASHPDRH